MITDQEFAELLADPTKEIVGDIDWAASPSHPGAQVFTARVRSRPSWPLRIEAWWSLPTRYLSYTVLYDDVGRILGLCMGARVFHHQPECHATRAVKRRCDCPRGTHKHRWTEQFADRRIYVPSDITMEWDEPVGVWRQFCAELNVIHRGTLQEPERNA